MGSHKKQVTFKAIVAALTILGILVPMIRSPCLVQGQSPDRDTQDVLLLVDNSVSMLYAIGTQPPSDPDGWRFVAASVVVNYLAVATESSITYRVALVSYAEQAETLASLSQLGETYRVQLTRMLDPDEPVTGNVGGWTNPHLALGLALEELEESPSLNPVRPPIVIILTDGDLEDNTLGLSAEQYFEEVESAVLALSKQGAVVHAVLLGDRARQNQPEWENLTALTGGQALPVDKAEDLPTAYIQLVRAIVGTIGVGSGVETAGVEEPRTLSVRELGVSLDENELPYIDSLIVTLWQTRKDISVRFVDPDGQVLVPIPGEVERRGSDYVVVWRIRGADLLAGDWKMLLSGGSQEGRVQIFADYIPLRAELLIPSVIAARGEPVTFQTLLVDRDGLPYNATEALEIQLNLYKEPENRLVSSETMILATEGGKIRHRLERTFDEAGVYALELLPRLHLKSGETRFLRTPEGLHWPVKIADQPEIREIRLEPPGKAEVGQSVRVWVMVERVEGQKDLTVLAWMKEHDSGRTVWEEDLRPGLRGTFEGEPFSLTSAGTYSLTVALQGEAPLPEEEVGFLYGPDTAYPIQKSVEYSVRAPTGLWIGGIEVGREGQAFRGEPAPIRVQVLGPEGMSVQKVEATIGGEDPVVLQDDGRLPDEWEGDGVFSGTLLAPAVEGNYRIKIVAQGESMYGVPLSDQGDANLTVTRVDLQIENIEVGEAGQALRGEPIPLCVQVIGPEGASIQKVEAMIGDEETVILQDNGRLPDEWEGDGVFSGTLLAPTVEGSYRIRVAAQGESTYGVPLSDQGEADLTVTRGMDLRIGSIEVGKEGQAFRGEPALIRVQVLYPERASVQKVEATIGDEVPIVLHDDGQLPDEREGDGVFSGTLVAPTTEGSYRARVVAQGESVYGVPLSTQGETDLTVMRANLKIENIGGGREGQAVRGETVPVRALVLAPEGASIQKVEAVMEDGEPISLLDDGQPPDEQKGDGIWSGEITVLRPGDYVLEIIATGKSGFGLDISDHQERQVHVIPRWYDPERAWRYGVGIIVAVAIVIVVRRWLRQRRIAPLIGSLEVIEPRESRGRPYELGAYAKPIIVGFGAGTIALGTPPDAESGRKARLEGRWTRSTFGREIAVYLFPLKGSTIRVAGSPVGRRGQRLFDGVRIEIEGLVLEYRSR